MVGNPNYDTQLIATTIEIWLRGQPTDVFFGELPLVKWLNKHTKIKKSGGLKYLEPLTTGAASAVGSYSGYDLLDLTPSEGLTNAEFEPKHYYGTVSFANTDLMKNKGKAKMIDIVDAEVERTKTTLADRLNGDFYLDGTLNGGKNVTGLAAMIAASGTYGNISRTTYSWWRSQVTAVGGALQVGGSSGMRRMHNDCGLGMKRMRPDGILTTQAIFEAYESMMDAQFRYSNSDKPRVGFADQDLVFRNAELMWDEDCPSGYMYWLNSKVMKLVVEPQRDGGVDGDDEGDSGDFRLGEWQTPVNQDAKIARIYWTGNLTCRNPRHLGVMTGLTNS
jgi:hypothetical protein